MLFLYNWSCTWSKIIHSHLELTVTVHPALRASCFAALNTLCACTVQWRLLLIMLFPQARIGQAESVCSLDAKQHYSRTWRWMVSLHVGRWVWSCSMPSQRWISLTAVGIVCSRQRQRSSVLIIRASWCTHCIWVGNQPATHFEGKERRKLLLCYNTAIQYNK